MNWYWWLSIVAVIALISFITGAQAENDNMVHEVGSVYLIVTVIVLTVAITLRFGATL